MDHSNELLNQCFSIFLFCIAVSTLFISYHSYTVVLNSRKDFQNKDIIMEQYNESQELIVSKGEVITYLMNELEYDIKVDELQINKTENVKENILSYTFNHEKYVKSYTYDNKGYIQTIVFKGL